MAVLFLNHPWAFAFGILGNIISFMVYLAPLPTFYRVFQKKSTEGFQSIPYIVALFSSMLWIYYAFLNTNLCLLITINSFGCVIETIYIIMYIIYAPKKAKMFTVKIIFLLNVVMFSLILLLTIFLSEGEERVRILGWVCVVFSVSVFVAPLSIIRLVICTKSVEFMPFFLSIFLTLSAAAWFFYGLLSKDKYVALPNVLGFIFGVVQIVLYFTYRNKKPPECRDLEHGIENCKICVVRRCEVHTIDSKSSKSSDEGPSGSEEEEQNNNGHDNT